MGEQFVLHVCTCERWNVQMMLFTLDSESRSCCLPRWISLVSINQISFLVIATGSIREIGHAFSPECNEKISKSVVRL